MQKWDYKMVNIAWDDEGKFFVLLTPLYSIDSDGKMMESNKGEKITLIELESHLLRLGQEGWELTSVIALTHEGTLGGINHYLKRPVE